MRKIFSFFVALMAVATLNANTYTRVVGLPTEGQYLIAYDDTDSIRVCNITDASGNFVKAKAVDNVITADLDDYVVELKAVEGGFHFQQVKTGKYIGGKSSGNALLIVNEPILNTIELVNNDSLKVVSETRIFLYNATSGQDRFRYFTAVNFTNTNYKKPVFFKANTKVEPQSDDWKADTISVTTAREYIKNNDPLCKKTHYVQGIVSSDYFGQRWPGYATIWMRDLVNVTDSLEGYKIYKNAKGEDFASLEELGLMVGDTVLLFADGLTLYNNSIYETTSGYLVDVKSNSSVSHLDITSGSASYDGTESVLELVFTTEQGDFVFLLDHQNGKAIVGDYTLSAETNVSLAGEALTLTNGKMTIAYAEGYNVNITMNTADKTYALTGAGLALGDFPDDKPYVPGPLPEGVKTCAEIYAIGMALADNATTEDEYRMRGWVITPFEPSADKNGVMQQSAWIADERTATSGNVKAQYCYFNELVVKGDYVELAGKVMKYVKDGAITIEFKNGQMTKLNTTEGFFNATESVKAVKRVINGQLFIERAGVLYTITGAAL